jgi:hypothetical protein
MDRRDFMKKAIVSSLMLSSGSLALLKSKKVFADVLDDRLLFCISASGAWDPTSFCDPLLSNGRIRQYGTDDNIADGTTWGDQFELNGQLNVDGIDGRFTLYNAEDVQTITRSDGSQFHVAPYIDTDGEVGKVGNGEERVKAYMVGSETNNIDFFETYKDELVIINGVNTRTNAHSVGQRHAWSGRIRVGAPHLAALWGALNEYELGVLPLTFASNGGFSATSGLLPVARATKKEALVDLTAPYAWAKSGGYDAPILTENLVELIKGYQNTRTTRFLNGSLPPHVKANIDKLRIARLAEPHFAPLADALEQVENSENGLFASNSATTQASILIAGMKAGICKGAMLTSGGFDTHSNHFTGTNSHPSKVKRLFDIIHYVREQLEIHGLWHKTILVVSSDFGRTRLNGGAKGKDHAPVTSTMIMGGADTGIGSGKNIGNTYLKDINPEGPFKSAKYVFAGAVQPNNGGLIDVPIEMLNDASANAFTITPSHIHHALRELLGINGHTSGIQDLFALPSEFTNTVQPFFEGS